MSLVKFMVLADIHLGALPKDRQWYDLEYLWTTIDAYRDHLDFGVICGDLFDYKNYASSEVFQLGVIFLFQLFMYSGPGMEWHIIEGTSSHDAKQLATLETIFDCVQDYIEETHGLDKSPRIFFHTKAKAVEIKGLKCLMIPEEYVVDQESYYKESFSHYYDFIFGHGMTNMMYYAEKKAINHVPGAPVFEVEQLTSISNYCFFGHVHTHKTVGRFESVGPFSRWEFGNSDAGFDIVYYDTETQTVDVKYIETETACDMPTITLNLDKDLTTKELDKELNRIIKEAEPAGVYKLRVIVFIDPSVDNATGMRIYIIEYFDKYPKISVIFKQGDQFFEEDGTEVSAEDMDMDEELTQILSYRDDITIQEFIEKNHGQRICLEDIQTIIKYKEE